MNGMTKMDATMNRVFKVDTSNVSSSVAEKYIKDLMTKYRKYRYYEPEPDFKTLWKEYKKYRS